MSTERGILIVGPTSEAGAVSAALMRLNDIGIHIVLVEAWPEDRIEALHRDIGEVAAHLNKSLQDVARAFNQLLEPVRDSMEKLIVELQAMCPVNECYCIDIIEHHEYGHLYPLRKRSIFTHIQRTYHTGGRAAKFR